MPGNPTERARNATIRFALQMAKRPKFADGGSVVGPLMGLGGGRTDTLPIAVPPGSYVIPADVVSGLPSAEGNSLQGHNALSKLFSSMPFMPDKAPYGASATPLAHGNGPAGKLHFASGGKTHHDGKPVDIMAAPGEFVVPPHVVASLGNGNMKLGHEMLDEFVKQARKKNISTLRKLPNPVKK